MVITDIREEQKNNNYLWMMFIAVGKIIWWMDIQFWIRKINKDLLPFFSLSWLEGAAAA